MRDALLRPVKPGKRDKLLVKELRRCIDEILDGYAAPVVAGAAARLAGADVPPVDGKEEGAASAAAEAGPAVVAYAPPPIDGVGAESFAAAGEPGVPPATPTAVEALRQPPDAGVIVTGDEVGAKVEFVCFLPAVGTPDNVLVGQTVSPAYCVDLHSVLVFVDDDDGWVMGQDDNLTVVRVTRVV